MTYRQELAREQRIQDGIVSRLKYSFNNNMSSIKLVYRYLHGSGQGFEKFWKKNGKDVCYKCIGNHKLYDEEMLLEAFRTDDSFRRFMDRNSDLPETVEEHFRKCIREVSRLRDDLYGHKEEYFGDGMNLTRKGRNRVRETWNAMRHFQGKQVYW